MNSESAPRAPQKQAGIATAEEGTVMLDGPDGVAVAMTPEAADSTGRSLIEAAEQATSQRDDELNPS